MALIFNTYAVIQALVLALFLGILYFLSEYFNFGNTIDGDFALVYQCMFAVVITAYMDLKGIKGKLFFIPTWIVFILFIILFSFQNKFSVSDRYFIYTFSAIVTIVFYFKYKKTLSKNWQNRIQLLNELKNNNAFEKNDSEYWKYLSHLYFKPSLLFLYWNKLYMLIYKNCVDKNEFYNYYKYILNTINTEEINNKRYKNWVIEHQKAFNESTSFDNYSNPEFAFTRLANLISDMN